MQTTIFPPRYSTLESSISWCSVAFATFGLPFFFFNLSHECLLQGIAPLYLRWLRSTFGMMWGRLTCSQVVHMFFKPRTARSRESVAHELTTQMDTQDYVGEATWYISHVWNSPFADTIDAILLFFEGRDDTSTVKVWFDLMVVSQLSQPSRPSSWYMIQFRDSIARMGNLLLIIDAWNYPTAMRRAW